MHQSEKAKLLQESMTRMLHGEYRETITQMPQLGEDEALPRHPAMPETEAGLHGRFVR